MGELGRAWQKPRGFLVDVLPAALYLALLFLAGFMPMKSLPGPDFEWIDKFWHLVAFGGLVLLLSRALRHFGRPFSLAARDACIASATLGGCLEVLQSLTPYRSAELADLLADVLGALLGYAFVRWLAGVSATPQAPAEPGAS